MVRKSWFSCVCHVYGSKSLPVNTFNMLLEFQLQGVVFNNHFNWVVADNYGASEYRHFSVCSCLKGCENKTLP